MKAAVITAIVLASIVVVGIIIAVIHYTKKNKVYTITYDLNGGHIETYNYKNSNPTSYTVNDTPIKLQQPTLCGYTFTGWTGSNGNTPEVNVTVTGTGNKSYIAHFEAKELIIDSIPDGKYFEYFGINSEGELIIRRISFNDSFIVPNDMLKNFTCDRFEYKLDSIKGYKNCNETDLLLAQYNCKKNGVTLTIENNKIEVPNEVTIIGALYKGDTEKYPYQTTTFPSVFNNTNLYKYPFSEICVSDYTKVAEIESTTVAKYNGELTYTWKYNPFPVDKANALYFDYICFKNDNYETAYYKEYRGTGSDGLVFKISSIIFPDMAFNFVGKDGVHYYTLIIAYKSNGDIVKEYPSMNNGKRSNNSLQFVENIIFNHSTAASYLRFMYYTDTNYDGPFYTALELKNMNIIN